MPVGVPPNELHGNANLISLPEYSSLHDGIHIERMGKVTDWFFCVLELHDRRFGDHFGDAKFGKFRGHGVSHAASKVVVRRPGPQISERQNGERMDHLFVAGGQPKHGANRQARPHDDPEDY